MFNLFPKNNVNDLLDTMQTNSMFDFKTENVFFVHGEKYTTEQLVKYVNDLWNYNQSLKEHIKKLENNTNPTKISELLKEIKDLNHLKQENVDLIEQLAKYKDGYQGSCYACETVGELNQKLELRLTAYQKMIEGASETIEKLKKELHEVTMENNSLKIFPPKDSDDVRIQKHPMYPFHWSGYDGDCSEYPEQYSKWLNEQKEKAINEEIIETIKNMKSQGFEDYDPMDFEQSILPKSFPNEFQEKTLSENLEKKFDEVKDVGNVFKTKTSWEEAASDLALRVVKLEKMVEELKLINVQLFPKNLFDKAKELVDGVKVDLNKPLDE